MSAAFGKTDNAAVNDLITELDKKYSADRKVPADDSTQNEGRPMQSYTEPLCTPDQVQLADSEVLTYVSSPSDVTFLIVGGKHLQENGVLPDLEAIDVYRAFMFALQSKLHGHLKELLKHIELRHVFHCCVNPSHRLCWDFSVIALWVALAPPGKSNTCTAA